MTSIDQVTLRRLLLAKQLYLHALEHSRQAGALNKMIAVHNFHNAIEVTLRGIALHHELRPERELNLDFETRLNLVDQAPIFKGQQKLPYRQELRKLNFVRNLVQHHAHEPEDSTMEEWRVFSHRFLDRAFREYFASAFDEIDGLDLIVDPRLRRVVTMSRDANARRDWAASARACKVAFRLGSASLSSFLPDEGFNSSLFVLGSLTRDADLANAFRPFVDAVYRRIRDAERYATVLSSGISPRDLQRFEISGPSTMITKKGFSFHSRKEATEESARWMHSFVVESLLRWQSAGLDPRVPDALESECNSFCDEVARSETARL
jgi:hypothetical protein